MKNEGEGDLIKSKPVRTALVILFIIAILVIGYVYFKDIFISKEVYRLDLIDSGNGYYGVLNVPGDIQLDGDYTFIVTSLILPNKADVTGSQFKIEFVPPSPEQPCTINIQTAVGSKDSKLAIETPSKCRFKGANGKYYFNATKIFPPGDPVSKVNVISIGIRKI